MAIIFTLPHHLHLPLSLQKCSSLTRLIMKNLALILIPPFSFNLEYPTTGCSIYKCPMDTINSTRRRLNSSSPYSNFLGPQSALLSKWRQWTALVRNLASSFLVLPLTPFIQPLSFNEIMACYFSGGIWHLPFRHHLGTCLKCRMTSAVSGLLNQNLQFNVWFLYTIKF